jgi:hypothetical protein
MQAMEFLAAKALVIDEPEDSQPTKAASQSRAESNGQRGTGSPWGRRLLGRVSLYLMRLGGRMVRFGIPQSQRGRN